VTKREALGVIKRETLGATKREGVLGNKIKRLGLTK
jgi:hypothetical protein